MWELRMRDHMWQKSRGGKCETGKWGTRKSTGKLKRQVSTLTSDNKSESHIRTYLRTFYGDQKLTIRHVLHYCKAHSKTNRKMENSTPCKIVIAILSLYHQSDERMQEYSWLMNCALRFISQSIRLQYQTLDYSSCEPHCGSSQQQLGKGQHVSVRFREQRQIQIQYK